MRVWLLKVVERELPLRLIEQVDGERIDKINMHYNTNVGPLVQELVCRDIICLWWYVFEKQATSLQLSAVTHTHTHTHTQCPFLCSCLGLFQLIHPSVHSCHRTAISTTHETLTAPGAIQNNHMVECSEWPHNHKMPKNRTKQRADPSLL